MDVKEYAVIVHLKGGVGFDMFIKEENAEIALNHVQGLLFAQDGWVQLNSANGAKHRVRADAVVHLEVQPRGEDYHV